jgi:hypothetical protein
MRTMLRIDLTIRINRPIEEVFTFISDEAHTSNLASAVIDQKLLTPGPVRVGTTFMQHLKMLGKRFEATMEVIEYEPYRNFGYKTTSSPVPFKVYYDLTPMDRHTHLVFAFESEPGTYFGIPETVLAKMVRRQLLGDLENMKDYLEEKHLITV